MSKLQELVASKLVESFKNNDELSDIDIVYHLDNCDIDDEDLSFDKITEYFEDQSVFNKEVIYYGRAMEYLMDNDSSLNESMSLAHDLGYTPDNINSELLASLLKSQNLRQEWNDQQDTVEELIDEVREDLESEKNNSIEEYIKFSAFFLASNQYTYEDCEELINATIEQFGDWDSFKENYENVCNNGIDGGFEGFIYHHNTVEFVEDNFDNIMAFSKEQAEELGEPGALTMFSKFKCLEEFSIDEISEALYSKESEYRDNILNGIAWYIGEEVCRMYQRFIEEQESEEEED